MTTAPAPIKIRTAARDVRPGQRVFPRVRIAGRRGGHFAVHAWIAESHLDDGYLLIRQGRATQRLSPGVIVLTLVADRFA